MNRVRKNSKNSGEEKRINLRKKQRGGIPDPRTGRLAIDIMSTEHNNMTVITLYGHQNIRTESRGMLLKSKVQEPDGDQGQYSRLLCLLLLG